MIRLELLRLLFFRFILGISDTKASNIFLIRPEDKLLSFNENDMFARDEHITSLNELFTTKPSFDLKEIIKEGILSLKNMLIEIIREWKDIELDLSSETNEKIHKRIKNLEKWLLSN